MVNIPDGYQNEFLFILEFNNKRIKDLNPLLRKVIEDIFPYTNENSIIKSWRNHHNYEKADILIKIDAQIKTISIKKGSRNSVHVEHLNTFEQFLKTQSIDPIIIKKYKSFHYGTDKNDKSKVLSSKEYSNKYFDEINDINDALSKIDIDQIINRFLLIGKHASFQIDGIIYGTPDNFLWINKNQITKIIKKHITRKASTVHISDLYIQPLNRCINNNTKYTWCKDYIQVKWYNLFDDIIEIMNNDGT